MAITTSSDTSWSITAQKEVGFVRFQRESMRRVGLLRMFPSNKAQFVFVGSIYSFYFFRGKLWLLLPPVTLVGQ